MPVANQTAVIRLLFVCPHLLTRTSLTLLLQRHPHLQVITCSAELTELVALAHKMPWDVILLVPEANDTIDLSLIRDIRQHLTQVPLITLTTRLDAATRTRLMTTNAQAHLSTAISEAELVAVIAAVARGERQQFVDTSLLKEPLPAEQQALCTGTPEKLTAREQEVLRLLLCDLTQEEIAQTLRLEYQSVRNYTHRICHKMGVRSRAALLARMNQPVAAL